MSKVEHPAHYGGADNPYEVIKVLRRWLTPTEFIGFCKGNLLKYTARANQKGGLEDHLKATFYSKEVATFVMDQRAAGEPDGLPVAPLFWTDLYPVPVDSIDEAISCTEHGCVAMLCSSVEPHVRWFVTLGDDQGEEVTEYFDAKAVAEKWLNDAREGAPAAAAAADPAYPITRAQNAALNGDLELSRSIATEHGISWHARTDAGFVMIDGTAVSIGSSPTADEPPLRDEDGDGA